jgi:hypothetical protein
MLCVLTCIEFRYDMTEQRESFHGKPVKASPFNWLHTQQFFQKKNLVLCIYNNLAKLHFHLG